MGVQQMDGKISLLLSAAGILFFVAFPLFGIAGETSTYDVVLAGKRCEGVRPREITCEYRVGNDLHFTIDGIGGAWTGIAFIKSDYDGDFYAGYGLGHGCVIVRRGKGSWKDQYCGGPGSPVDVAFVSTKTGDVYRNWSACME